jgi:fructose-specific phosphotransferase system IIC component
MTDKRTSRQAVGRFGCLTVIVGLVAGFVGAGLIGNNLTAYERGGTSSDSLDSFASFMIYGAITLIVVGIVALVVAGLWSVWVRTNTRA